MTLVLGVLLFALLGVAHNSGPTRRFWRGFAVFGWGYLTVIFGTLFKDIGDLIPTTDLLSELHDKIAVVGAPPDTDAGWITIWLKPDGGYEIDGQCVADDIELVDAFSKVAAAKPSARYVTFYFDRNTSPATITPELERILGKLHPTLAYTGQQLPLRPDFGYFSIVGHTLITLLASFLGGLVARMLLGLPADASKRGSDG